MSAGDKHSTMRGRLTLVSSQTAIEEVTCATAAASRTYLAGGAEGASLPPRRPGFDPAMMPKPSANQQRFLELLSMGEGSASSVEDDPAFAVGVALFFWRFSRRGMPMPKRAMAPLDRHAAAGDPACLLVRDWLRKKMVSTGKRPLWVFEGGQA